MNERDEIEQDQDEGEAASPEAGDGQQPGDKEKILRDLELKTKEAAEANDKFLRTYADFDNYRKRMQRDLADFRKFANEQLALELLTVVDNLGLALKHAAEAGEAGQGLQQGVELVHKQLRDLLEKFGVKQFSSEGEVFDPAKHAAVMQVVTADVPENTVVQVLQEGYMYHDKVLRHAKVGVSKKPQPETVAASKD
jgi:molecular chaperone GrpE